MAESKNPLAAIIEAGLTGKKYEGPELKQPQKLDEWQDFLRGLSKSAGAVGRWGEWAGLSTPEEKAAAPQRAAEVQIEEPKGDIPWYRDLLEIAGRSAPYMVAGATISPAGSLKEGAALMGTTGAAEEAVTGGGPKDIAMGAIGGVGGAILGHGLGRAAGSAIGKLTPKKAPKSFADRVTEKLAGAYEATVAKKGKKIGSEYHAAAKNLQRELANWRNAVRAAREEAATWTHFKKPQGMWGDDEALLGRLASSWVPPGGGVTDEYMRVATEAGYSKKTAKVFGEHWSAQKAANWAEQRAADAVRDSVQGLNSLKRAAQSLTEELGQRKEWLGTYREVLNSMDQVLFGGTKGNANQKALRDLFEMAPPEITRKQPGWHPSKSSSAYRTHAQYPEMFLQKYEEAAPGIIGREEMFRVGWHELGHHLTEMAARFPEHPGSKVVRELQGVAAGYWPQIGSRQEYTSQVVGLMRRGWGKEAAEEWAGRPTRYISTSRGMREVRSGEPGFGGPHGASERFSEFMNALSRDESRKELYDFLPPQEFEKIRKLMPEWLPEQLYPKKQPWSKEVMQRWNERKWAISGETSSHIGSWHRHQIGSIPYTESGFEAAGPIAVGGHMGGAIREKIGWLAKTYGGVTKIPKSEWTKVWEEVRKYATSGKGPFK